MPTVPTYMPGSGSNQSVTSQSTANADSFGAGQAQLTEQAGQAGLSLGRDGLDMATQMQDVTNRAKVRDAISQAQNSALDYVTDNVVSKKGIDAMGTMPTTTDTLKQQQQSYSDNLDNPAQKQMFNEVYPEVFNHAVEMARRHVMEQTLAYNTDTLTAAKASAVNAAVIDYNNPKTIASAEAAIVADNRSLYSGMPVEAAANTQSEISTLHTNVATAMAANDPVGAANYIRANKNKILPAQFDKINQDINTRVVTTGALKTANTLSALDPQQALATAQQIQDPTARQLTIDALNTHFSAKNSADALSAANQDADNLTTVLGDPANAAANLPANLPPQQRAQLVQAAADRLKAQTNGQQIQSNPQVYTSLIQQAANDPDGFLRRPLSPYISQLSNDDWNSITSIRNDLAKKRDSAQDKAFELSTVDQVFTNATKDVPELSLDPKVIRKANPSWWISDAQAQSDVVARQNQVAAFKQDFTDRFNTQYPDPKDRTATNAETLLNGMLARQVVQKGWISDRTAPAALVQENPTLNRANFGTTMEPHAVNGTTYFYNYNSDRTAATVYDANGKKVGTWPASN